MRTPNGSLKWPTVPTSLEGHRPPRLILNKTQYYIPTPADLSFSTRLFANALVQYNSLDGDFSTNVRLNFIHRPGSDLFIVFTENRSDELNGWALSDRGLVSKLTYLMRF